MSARARRRQRHANGSIGKKVALAFGAVFAAIGIAAGAGALWVLDVAASAPDIDTLKPAEPGANSEVFAADGTSLGYVQADVLRTPVTLDQVPKRLRKATIAIEDENFYEHEGVDYSAIVRAALKNFEEGEVREGASTITQQLVRNLYIENPEDTVERKIIEAKMAMDYEEEYSKDEILDQYLNTASYGTTDGRTAVGVQAASQVFFNKDVSDLDVKEAALLAGLPQAPSEYNPFTNRDDAKGRRNDVLDAMAEQGYISQEKAAELKDEGLGLERGYLYESRTQQYFFDFVQQQLIDEYGVKTVRDGGLKVYTTLDPKLQAAAEQAIADNNDSLTGAAEALVSLDAETGEIKAMASSEAYEDSQFNLAAQGRRQPGSSFKPYALAAMVAQGGDPDSTFYSTAAQDTFYPDGPAGAPWQVASDASGTMDLREALAQSVNGIYAQLAIDIGPEAMDDMARKLGVESPLSGYASDVLGASDVTVLDQASAYATFANGGVHHDPTAIARVEFPDGEVDSPEDTDGTRVISDGVAAVMQDVMTGPLDYGTAAGYDIPCPAAGKTGTTETNADAWFIGYTPHVSTAVWVGNPNSRTPLPGYGGTLAAPIWQDYMMVAASEPCDDFPEPENPASLTPYYGDLTSSSSDSDYSDTTTTTDETTSTDEPGGVTTPDEGNYDPDLYAPGAGQDPLPAPDGDQGGGPPANPGNGNGGGPPTETGGATP